MTNKVLTIAEKIEIHAARVNEYTREAEALAEREAEAEAQPKASLTAEDILGALVNLGADAALVETEEQAQGVFDIISRSNGLTEVDQDNEEEWDVATSNIDFIAPRHVYTFNCGVECYICFAEDWD